MHELSHLSLWHATMTDEEWGPGRPAISGDIDADVAIVGAGYTGMWTAYYLLQRDPSLKVVLLEANVVGFGASGRNGGWCSGLLPMGLDAIAAESSRDEAVRLQRAMFDTVGEVARVVASEGIDCHWQQGGWVAVARNELQMQRMRSTSAPTGSAPTTTACSTGRRPRPCAPPPAPSAGCSRPTARRSTRRAWHAVWHG